MDFFSGINLRSVEKSAGKVGGTYGLGFIPILRPKLSMKPKTDRDSGNHNQTHDTKLPVFNILSLFIFNTVLLKINKRVVINRISIFLHISSHK